MYSYSELIPFLRRHGYTDSDSLAEAGTLRVTGDVVAVRPAGTEAMYRLHFFGEELERTELMEDGVWQRTYEEPNLLPNQLDTPHGLIKPGEYVVHLHHGVGIFAGIKARPVDGREQRYVELEYAGNDALLVPYENRRELTPYIGARKPRLARLNSRSWQTTKARIEKDLIGVARGLLKIFMARHRAARPPYPHAPEWEAVLDASAGFRLTDGQNQALAEIRHDLEVNELPMDRLLCGDVGYGKTEVALRAAAAVLAAGKQVALIAPTTVLAEQHFRTAQARFSELPVRTVLLSRGTQGLQRSSIGKLADGTADLAVGTHRLLNPSVAWKDLGLIIIDEEQKFGVKQKELLKELRASLDVLSLSATPIPRTLSMGLSGLKGLSVLRQPPQGRLAVRTVVAPYADTVFAEALRREKARGGQSLVVYNRVRTLDNAVQRIRRLTSGELTVAGVHGQQPAVEVSAAMEAFLDGRTDVLVASTIIEHGIDAPQANTLAVLHAERFGLSDLYQLRGRVGRRQKQAHAFFFTGGFGHDGYGEEGALAVGRTVQLRLQALAEADELGSGWSIALKDLEIRGGGNVLGTEQHGAMESIGLLLYSQLLQEEIGRQAQRAGIDLFRVAAASD